MDLLFFPIVRDNHWVLVCINMFLKQVSWFNSINASTRTRCYGCAKNLVTNFSKEAIEADVFKEDVSQFEWIFPKDLDPKN